MASDADPGIVNVPSQHSVDDIVNALTAFHDSGGVRRPSAAYTTGYDFMTSEADAINSALSHNLGTGGTAAADIGSSWTKADAVAGIDAAPAGLVVNAASGSTTPAPSGLSASASAYGCFGSSPVTAACSTCIRP